MEGLSVNKQKIKVPYRHSGARIAKGVSNALALTKKSHKPVSNSLAATLQNTLQKGYCLKAECQRPAFE